MKDSGVLGLTLDYLSSTIVNWEYKLAGIPNKLINSKISAALTPCSILLLQSDCPLYVRYSVTETDYKRHQST
jgi:hypothetical protein